MSDFLSNPLAVATAGNVVLVDKKAFARLKAAEMGEVVQTLISRTDMEGKTWRIVESLSHMKSRDEAERLLRANDPAFVEALLLRGVPLTPVQIEQIRISLSQVQATKDTLFAMIGEDVYELQPVPNNYKLPFRITGQTIQRAHSSRYTIGVKTARRIFNAALKAWKDRKISYTYAQASGRRNSVYINPKTVQIGCQTFSRRDIEQLGLHMGWFPEKQLTSLS